MWCYYSLDFCLTADFRNFDLINKYLLEYTNKYLLIEWVEPDDEAIKYLQHIKKRQNLVMNHTQQKILSLLLKNFLILNLLSLLILQEHCMY